MALKMQNDISTTIFKKCTIFWCCIFIVKIKKKRHVFNRWLSECLGKHYSKISEQLELCEKHT